MHYKTEQLKKYANGVKHSMMALTSIQYAIIV